MKHARYKPIARLASLGSIVAGLCGCAGLEAPETGARAQAGVLAADYPELLTDAQISGLAPDPEETALSQAEQDALEERLARLKARAAAAARRDVLGAKERQRLQNAI